MIHPICVHWRAPCQPELGRRTVNNQTAFHKWKVRLLLCLYPQGFACSLRLTVREKSVQQAVDLGQVCPGD